MRGSPVRAAGVLFGLDSLSCDYDLDPAVFRLGRGVDRVVRTVRFADDPTALDPALLDQAVRNPMGPLKSEVEIAVELLFGLPDGIGVGMTLDPDGPFWIFLL